MGLRTDWLGKPLLCKYEGPEFNPHNPCWKSQMCWAGKVAQWIKALATMSDKGDLNSIPRTHVVERK